MKRSEAIVVFKENGKKGPTKILWDIPTRLLVLANLVPLFGSIFLGWGLFEILMVYWLESGVIGFYNILKMVLVKIPLGYTETMTILGSRRKLIGNTIKFFMIPFFMVHYGGFMFGHLIFILFFGSMGSNLEPSLSNISGLFWPLIITTTTLMISHGVSFTQNFIGKKEYQSKNIGALMMAPYARIIVMHITLILGGFLILITGLPTVTVSLFIILKTIVDLFAHARSHQK